MKKQSTLRKTAFWGLLSAAAKIAIALSIVNTGAIGFALGAATSKATAPRQTDIDNVSKLYRVNRLYSDLAKQKALLDRLSVLYDDKNKAKKSVYGLANV